MDFAERVAELIADPARGADLGRLGRARVLERLSWEHSVPALLAAYERVFRDRAGGWLSLLGLPLLVFEKNNLRVNSDGVSNPG